MTRFNSSLARFLVSARWFREYIPLVQKCAYPKTSRPMRHHSRNVCYRCMTIKKPISTQNKDDLVSVLKHFRVTLLNETNWNNSNDNYFSIDIKLLSQSKDMNYWIHCIRLPSLLTKFCRLTKRHLIASGTQYRAAGFSWHFAHKGSTPTIWEIVMLCGSGHFTNKASDSKVACFKG